MYLRNFYSIFPLIKSQYKPSNKAWITKGIKTSFLHKRELISSNTNNPNLREHCKCYYKTLSNVIKEAKQLYYNGKISNFNNPMKTAWNIIKNETLKRVSDKGIHLRNINEK